MAGELILIVEDNEKNRKLERDTPPALVLIDIQLPGMNGIEARPAREQADELRRPPGPRTRERRRPIEDQPRPWT